MLSLVANVCHARKLEAIHIVIAMFIIFHINFMKGYEYSHVIDGHTQHIDDEAYENMDRIASAFFVDSKFQIPAHVNTKELEAKTMSSRNDTTLSYPHTTANEKIIINNNLTCDGKIEQIVVNDAHGFNLNGGGAAHTNNLTGRGRDFYINHHGSQVDLGGHFTYKPSNRAAFQSPLFTIYGEHNFWFGDKKMKEYRTGVIGYGS